MENIAYHLPDGTHYDPFYCRSAREYIQYKEEPGNCACFKGGNCQHLCNCINQTKKTNIKGVNVNKIIVQSKYDNGNHV